MSEPLTRAERSSARLENRNGTCVSGSCRCDTYEPAGMKDGYATCTCTHTRWAHSVQAKV